MKWYVRWSITPPKYTGYWPVPSQRGGEALPVGRRASFGFDQADCRLPHTDPLETQLA
jgi:hypothetical protein